MACVAIADQIDPDDRGAGYLLRRVIRRALESIRVLSQHSKVNENDVLALLAQTTIDTLSGPFPELSEQSSRIFSTLQEEAHLYSTAIIRNGLVMKLAKSLSIELNENAAHNHQTIEDRIVKLESSLGNVQAELKKHILDQAGLDQCRKDFQFLQQLITNDPTLSQRFGLKSDSIDRRFEQLELYLIEVENNLSEAVKSIINQFESESAKNLIQSSHYTLVSVDSNFTRFRDVDSFVQKISLDLYGERLLVVLIRSENELLIQLSVPGKYQQSLQANVWFESIIEQLNLEGVRIETIQTKRPRKLAKYRCHFTNNELLNNVIEQFQHHCLEYTRNIQFSPVVNKC